MASLLRTLSFTTGSIAPTASTSRNDTIVGNIADIVKITVTPSNVSAGQLTTVGIYKHNTFLAADLAYSTSAFAGNLIDPIEYDGLTQTERNQGYVCKYEDADNAQQLHIKITNGGSLSRTFSVVITYMSILDVGSKIVDARTFGVTGDGSTDDTAAIRRAIAFANTGSTSSSGVGSYTYSRPRLFFPEGIYKVTGDLAASESTIDSMIIEGDGAIFEVSAGITFMSKLNYNITFRDITVRGGAIALQTATSNLEAIYTIENCDFHQQTTATFVNNMQSATWLIIGGHIHNFTSTGQVYVDNVGGICTFIATRIIASSTGAGVSAFDIKNTHLTLDMLCGTTGAALDSWVTMRDGTYTRLTVRNSRLAFDSGGGGSGCIRSYAVATNVLNTGFPNGITIRDSQIYSAGPALYLYAIPNEIDCTGTIGLTQATPIVVDSGISAANLATIGSYPYITRYRFEFNSLDYTHLLSAASPAIARNGLHLLNDRPLVSARANAADLSYQSQGNTGAYTPIAVTTSNVTASTANDEFGVPYEQFLATANNGSAYLPYTTALNGLAAGIYTAIFDIEVTTNHVVQCDLTAANVACRTTLLPRGKHSVALPFDYDGGASQTIALGVNYLPNTANIRWNRWKIFKGRVAVGGKRLELDGTAAPVAGQWYRGDIVYNSNHTPGTADYWTCFVSGSPGTWAANKVSGSFTLTNGAPTKVVANANWLNSTTLSSVFFTPNSAAAAALQGTSAGIIIVAGTSGTSFTVQTGDGTNAAGTETYTYTIFN